MMHLNDDPIPASRIPRVRELCRALGFEGSSIQFQKTFIRWRKNYRTASGVSGMDITDWASATERYNLGVMAQHYLQTGGHAQQYWPSHGPASPRAGPEYPKDEIIIAELLRKLIWRQNECARRNAVQKAKSALSDDDDFFFEVSRLSAGHSPPIFTRRRSRQQRIQLSHDVVSAKFTKDWSAVEDEQWEPASHGLPDTIADLMGGLPSESSNEDLGSPFIRPLRGNVRRPIDLETKNDEDGERQNTLAKSQGVQMHQSPQGRAPVAQMVFSPLPGLFAESTSYPSRSHLGNASPAQATRPLAATAGARDDDTEDEASNTPRRLSGPKRRLLSQPDASLGTRKSTKRRHISESPEQCNNMPPTVAGEEDSDTLLVPRSRRKRRSSTFAASKVSHHIWNLSTSSSDTSPSGLSDDGTSESETLVQRKNPYARSSLSNNTAHCALDTLLPTPTLDFDTARRIDNPRAHPSTGTKVDDSNHSQVHPFACPPNSNASTRARTEQPSPAVKLRINIFVDASCGSHVDIKKWPDGRFKDKTPCAIFDQVSALIIRNDVKSIKLELKTLKKEHELNSIIERDDDVEAFEMILRKFNGRIRERKDAGETEFKMLLKPEFEQQGAAEADVAQGSKSDEDYL